MKGKRFLYTVRLCMIRNSRDRAEYLKKKGVFYFMGNNVTIMDRTVPLYAKLIKIGNNVHIASNVHFVTHDVTYKMLNGLENVPGYSRRRVKFREKVGCIDVGDNVFIGSGTRILYNVKIGNNCVIGADTLVNKDIPPNSVVGGVPAKVIGSFENFVSKRMTENQYPDEYSPVNQIVGPELVEYLWEQFERSRSNK